ncbi:HlyD family type I secretion periplasmic adaptor subunit [Phyllobacterium zundukense]|uniref:HlyD family type I secretion periplasmic adaptor subunit n=1 Tax=Phyllobacterium zundukense TaxID=1867719 RepID=A0ACD4CX43_9HYPH|nr:HlyD family type I secretion periplasmic adaptor subunit [Phyllobacterium zundukense]UXN58109.1 HlyD family type I secretion periplasmic adaptor subunit [Phyllobacterium zundukense]
MSNDKKNPAAASIRVHMIVGLCTSAILVFGAGGWAAIAQLSGAVMGTGTVMVDGNVKKVQHREGGIVGEILVRDGARVKAGDLLVRLDDTLTRANLAMVTKQIDQFTARRLRLVAEREESLQLSVSENTSGGLNQSEFEEYLRAEMALFTARKRTIDGQKEQLRQRISQIGQENEGLVARREGKNDEVALIERELEGVSSLYQKGLIPYPRMAELQRMKAQLAGERGQFVAEIARAANRITETELQILQLDQDRRAEVLTELRDTDSKLAELSEQRIAASDQLKRIDIRAPQDGLVHELALHTIGGVVAPGETVLQIVPDRDSLIVEARLKPADIDQVHVGQRAELRFSAFNQRTTPEIAGYVKTVAADLLHNAQTGESWYFARIEIPQDELDRLENLVLVPGMPVETFIQTGDRTALSFLAKPLFDQLARALREE